MAIKRIPLRLKPKPMTRKEFGNAFPTLVPGRLVESKPKPKPVKKSKGKR